MLLMILLPSKLKTSIEPDFFKGTDVGFLHTYVKTSPKHYLFSYPITAFVEIIALMRVFSCNSTSVKVFVHSHCQECVEFLLQFLKSWLEFNLALNAVYTALYFEPVLEIWHVCLLEPFLHRQIG